MSSRRLSAAVSLALLVAACAWLHTRGNHFPYNYHPDEPGKVEQVLTERWNFHHPMLLLASTSRLVALMHVPREEQAVVETGRLVSACFTALAVATFALLAGLWRGKVVAVAVGLALALHHQLFELSHYMKEDAALLFGIALSFLAAFFFARAPSSTRALFLGLACGVAVSGKYVGIVSLAIALPVLWHCSGTHRARGFVCFGVAVVATFAAVNYPLLTQLASSRESFGHEWDLVVHGQSGVTRRVPHSEYWNAFVTNTAPAIWVLLIVFLVARWRERRSVQLTEWFIIGFPFAFAVALSFSPKSNDRYFLPATAVFTLLAALGVADAPRLFPRMTKARVEWLAVALLTLGQLPGLARYVRAFSHDDNADLIAWLRAGQEVAPDAVIAKDSRIGLPEPERKRPTDRRTAVPQRVLAPHYVADLGSLDSLRALGVTHVAVSESDYGGYFRKSMRPKKGEEVDFARHREFYEQLFRAQPPLRLLFRRDRGTVIYLHPGIRVYRIIP